MNETCLIALSVGISVIILIFVLFALIILCHISKNKKLHHWFCRHLGWHTPDIYRSFDGCSYESTCKWCKRKILQDGQGNWFGIGDKNG